MEYFLLQFFIFLAASAIAIPVAKKLGLGSVLGYLLAGVAIGPFGTALIDDVKDVMHFTEFGVVMMLFLVGLELKPSLLWKMKTPIFGMGGMHVAVTSLALFAIGCFFFPWQQALTIGLALSLSSTAIVLQTIKEKGLMHSPAGRSIFSVLLFQDMAVIPMLAFLPLLATFSQQPHTPIQHESALFDISSLPASLQLVMTLLAIGMIFFLARYASRPVFRVIAATGIREIFVAAALALVVGISLLMIMVGLSPALGTFLAGVVLADSEYRHELVSDIDPFKGLLLGVFFISIGASLNFTLIGESIGFILAITVGLMLLKALILIITSSVFNIRSKDRALFVVALAQGGEFAFVLFQAAKVNGVLTDHIVEPFISAVAISMFLTPLMFIIHEKYLVKEEAEESAREDDKIERSGHRVILAGFGRFGTDLGRFLISAGIKPVIIDHDAHNIDILRKMGYQVYYGDIMRLDLLQAAGASDAELLIVTIGDIKKASQLIELVRKHYPQLKVIVNAHDRYAAFKLMDHKVDKIRLETFDSAVSLGQDALESLGVDPYEALRLGRIFSKKDREMLPELYALHLQEDDYFSYYQQKNADLEKLMRHDMEADSEELDKAWTAKNSER